MFIAYCKFFFSALQRPSLAFEVQWAKCRYYTHMNGKEADGGIELELSYLYQLHVAKQQITTKLVA